MTSWSDALGRATNYAVESRLRYKVTGIRSVAGWIYVAQPVRGQLRNLDGEPLTKSMKVSRKMDPVTDESFQLIMASMPRCVQRAAKSHGGDTKREIRSRFTAERLAAFIGQTAYECPLPHPSGPHFHLRSR